MSNYWRQYKFTGVAGALVNAVVPDFPVSGASYFGGSSAAVDGSGYSYNQGSGAVGKANGYTGWTAPTSKKIGISVDLWYKSYGGGGTDAQSIETRFGTDDTHIYTVRALPDNATTINFDLFRYTAGSPTQLNAKVAVALTPNTNALLATANLYIDVDASSGTQTVIKVYVGVNSGAKTLLFSVTDTAAHYGIAYMEVDYFGGYGTNFSQTNISIDDIASGTTPSITSPSTGSGTNGTAYSYQILATSVPTSYAASSLPSGLSINTSTGLISGTPAVTAGNYTIAMTATNAAGSGTQNLVLTLAGGTGTSTITNAITINSLNATSGSLTYDVSGLSSPTITWYKSQTYGFTPSGGNQVGGLSTQTVTITPPTAGNPPDYYVCRVVQAGSTTLTSYQRPVYPALGALKIGYVGDSRGVQGGAANTISDYIKDAIEGRVGHRDISVVNGSVSGSASAQWVSGSTNLNAFLAAGDAVWTSTWTGVVVVVNLGVNDGQAAVASSTFNTNMTSLLGVIVARGAKVALSYPTWREPGTAVIGGNTFVFDETYWGFALQYFTVIDALVNGSTIYAGDRFSQIESGMFPATDLIDHIHPTPVGERITASQEGNAILTALGLVPTGGGSTFVAKRRPL